MSHDDPLDVVITIPGDLQMPQQDQTPQHSQGFGAAEDVDATRQGQHTFANDTPTDVNNNAILARSQAQTTDLVGKQFAANSDRRDKMADALMAKILKEEV